MNKNSIKHLPSIFEKAASDTWKRLKASSELGVSQNETTVVKAKNTRGYRNFNCIHSEVSTLPFRCLVACPMILSIYAGASRFPTGFEDYAEAQLFESLPRNIQQSIETGYFQEWDSNFYSNEIPYRPARILVAELPYWSNQR